MPRRWFAPATLWLPLLILVAAVDGRVFAAPPNVILIMADDLGYGDLSCYGQERFTTPHLDRLASEGLRFTQTDQYDPNPRARVKLREWHLTGTTAGKEEFVEFVVTYRPYKGDAPAPMATEFRKVAGGHAFTARAEDREALVLLPSGPDHTVEAQGFDTRGAVAVRLRRGAAATTLRTDQ